MVLRFIAVLTENVLVVKGTAYRKPSDTNPVGVQREQSPWKEKNNNNNRTLIPFLRPLLGFVAFHTSSCLLRLEDKNIL